MPITEMITCLEQKVILLTQILGLTKQIEVRSKEIDIQLDNLLENRGGYILRVNKCDNLILNLTKEMPPEQQDLLSHIAHADALEADCNEEQLQLLKLSKDCVALLQKTAVVDKSARDAIQKQFDEVKDEINKFRKNSNPKTIHRNIL